jgi:ElaB/YqjD/DUF883 family membrane-anchored ribosome-binding protein
MTTRMPTKPGSGPIAQATPAADQAIHNVHRLADDAIPGPDGGLDAARSPAGPAHTDQQASELVQRAADVLRISSQELSATAATASQRTTRYVRSEPFKAVMFAAATGATLMAIAGLLTRSRERA